MLHIVATVTPIAGKEALLKQKLLELAPITHREKGCAMYAIHETVERPTRFVFVEKWQTPEDLQAHLNAPHIQAAFALKGTLFSDIEILTLNSLTASNPTQGVF